MSLANYVGLAMVVTFFIGITVMLIKIEGVRWAFIILGSSIAITAFLGYAVKLLTL